MGILDKLIASLPKSNDEEKLLMLCNQIEAEEKINQKYPHKAPKGSRILLTLEVPGKTIREIGYITLQLEDEDSYTVAYYTLQISAINDLDTAPRIQKVWNIDKASPEKVLIDFAKKVKFLKGLK